MRSFYVVLNLFFLFLLFVSAFHIIKNVKKRFLNVITFIKDKEFIF